MLSHKSGRQVNSQARRVDPLQASAHQGLAFNAWWVGRLDEAAGSFSGCTRCLPVCIWRNCAHARS